MSNINDLHKLIINNLAIITKANKLIPEIETKIDDEITKIMLKWVAEESWLSDKNREETVHCYQKKWVEEDKPVVFFVYLYVVEVDNEGNRLASLFDVIEPVNSNFNCFCFTFEYGAIGYNQKKWKKFLQTEFKKYENTPEFEHIEIYDGVNLIVKFKIDPQVLVDNYPDTIEDALTPVVDALAVIKNAAQKIDEIYQAALANRA